MLVTWRQYPWLNPLYRCISFPWPGREYLAAGAAVSRCHKVLLWALIQLTLPLLAPLTSLLSLVTDVTLRPLPQTNSKSRVTHILKTTDAIWTKVWSRLPGYTCVVQSARYGGGGACREVSLARRVGSDVSDLLVTLCRSQPGLEGGFRSDQAGLNSNRNPQEGTGSGLRPDPREV